MKSPVRTPGPARAESATGEGRTVRGERRRPPAWRVWSLAARPKTLPAAATPVIVGTAVAQAGGGLRPGPALAALAGALAIQIGTNLANDLFDFLKGTDDGERLGPLRVAQAGWLAPRQLRAGIALSYAAALACGLYLTAVAGWPVVVIGLASLLAGLAYTGGPFPLAYNGLGDLFVLLFFGFVAVGGTVYVQLSRLPPATWFCGATVGVLATAILVVNNVRDEEGDRRAGKRTLAVLLGGGVARVEYAVLLGLAYLLPAWMVRAGLAPAPALACLATLPLGWRLVRTVGRPRDAATLNRALASTAFLLLLHGLLLSAGLVWPSIG